MVSKSITALQQHPTRESDMSFDCNEFLFFANFAFINGVWLTSNFLGDKIRRWKGVYLGGKNYNLPCMQEISFYQSLINQ